MDTLTPEQRSERMSRVRGKGSRPEMRVRQIVHGLGYRYRLHAKDIPGKPDLVFRSRRKVIFVHGCFWHRHPDPACKLARRPKSRHEFWDAKFESNIARDAVVMEQIVNTGWRALVLWECHLRDTETLGRQIREFLDS